MTLLLEEDFVVLMALVETLDLGDGDNASDDVAGVFLTFLSENGKIMEFLKLLVSREAVNTENPSTLFRGNTVASKLLSKYTMMNGKEFLDGCLR
jgi:hypothetical protein